MFVASAIEAWPARAQLRPGQPLELVIRSSEIADVQVSVTDGTASVAQSEVRTTGAGETRLTMPLPDSQRSAAFAIEVRAPGLGNVRATTAIDVAGHWSSAPRYGFFSDFHPDETPEESARRADGLLRLHVNVVQFYDWMASHHTYLPASDEFVDPLGRQLSHVVVRRKIALARERGMAALAYGALYGAEADFSLARPDWLLYDGRHQPLSLADIFYLQDFGPGSPWREWIIGQYEHAVDAVGFDGIHIDQYGCPKRSLSRLGGEWHAFDAGAEFPGFVQEAATRIRAQRPEGGSIFNLVNAWPLDLMPPVTSDAATYIEVWPPHTRYRDLYDLIRRARTLRPDKAVILAAYLQPFRAGRDRSAGALLAFRLASAAIASSGGFHLLFGEGDSLLTEAYYPRYGRIEPDERAVVRRYADFAVRNTLRLHAVGATDIAWTDVGPENDVIVLSHPELESYGAGAGPGSLWVVGREQGATTTLQLINLRGLASDAWNVDQPSPPKPLEGVEVRVQVVAGVDEVWWDTPDDEVGLARSLPFEVIEVDRGRHLVFRVPRIDVWSMVSWRTADVDRRP